jgi:hypothetical protein
MAIAHDANASGLSASSPATFSHTCTGSDRILFVAAASNTSETVTGVTYNGVSMTEVDSVTAGATQHLFYLVAPATGANNVVVSTSGSVAVGSSVSYTGVDQTSPIDATALGATAQTVTNYTASITSVADNSWSIMTSRTGNGYAWTGDTGTTVRNQPETTYLGSGGMVDSGAAITPAGSDTLGVTSTSQLYDGGILVTIAPLITDYTLPAGIGAFTLTGVSAVLNLGRTIAAGIGSFILTGLNVTLTGPRWSNPPKTSSTMSNTSKNSSTMSNSNKTSSTWSNQSKS